MTGQAIRIGPDDRPLRQSTVAGPRARNRPDFAAFQVAGRAITAYRQSPGGHKPVARGIMHSPIRFRSLPSAWSKAPLAMAALACAALSLALAACKASDDLDDARGSGTEIGIALNAMDKTIKPGDDFYAYANGAWMRATAIPADKAMVGSHSFADETTRGQLDRLIDDIVKGNPAPDSDPGRIRTFYTTYIDTRSIDQAGLAPIKPDLDRFAAIADVKGLSRVLGQHLRADVDPINNTDWHTENLFGVFVTRALGSDAVMPYFLQGGLGLPEREYYLSPEPQMAAIRAQYRAYIARLLSDAGIGDSEVRAKRVYDLELRIASAHATRAQSEDYPNSETEWSRADFVAKAPGIDWEEFFAAAGLSGQQRFAAYHAGAIAKLSALVAKEPIAAWQDWLVFHQLNAHADVLPSRLDADHFAFYGTVLSGVTAQKSREERGIEALGDALGDALGKLYVEQYFPASAKREIEGMVTAIKASFVKRIDALGWMAPETRSEAREKVRTMEVGVGYPDTWKDYSSFNVVPGAAYANKIAGELVQYRQQLAKIGKPLDRREWWMNVQLVNAVNLPVQNALNFPAATLQRPFFDPKADPAFNYGALGATIGHEISHSFDNNGAAFDAAGKLRNWWTPADLARFTKEGKALAAQFDSYAPFPGVHVNGTLTFGENIADVAGLAAAYDAYRASLKGKEPPVIDGFTGDQRFFIAFTQSWATKQREESLRGRIATDSHAPGQYRALTVRNLDAWYKAFDVQPGDNLYLPADKRVRIW